MRVLIVGGVAAGASTAARLRRLDEEMEIIMFERGTDVSFANCGLPYYVGGVIEKRKKLLVQTPEIMTKRFNIDVRVMSEVIEINRNHKEVKVKNWQSGELYTESYDYLVLCPGAQPLMHEIEDASKDNVFVVRNVQDSDAIRSYIQTEQPRTAAVIGAGYIGLEMAEMLNECGLEVTIIEAADQILTSLDADMAAIVQNYITRFGIDLVLSDRVVVMEGGDRVKNVQLSSGSKLPADIVIIGIGVKPETGLARAAGLEIGVTGGMVVDEYLRTADPYIYAAGDVIQVKDFITEDDSYVPLAGPANRQGWIVANNLTGRQIKYHGPQGTSIVKFETMTAAASGLNEKQLKKKGLNYIACHAHPFSHANYYPGATQMTVKLLVSPDKGGILGAQVVGYDNVDKTIDVLATAIRAGMNVWEIQEIDLAYAPPFSSAKSPPNMIGYVAANVIEGYVDIIQWQKVLEQTAAGAMLVDVRTPSEAKKGMVPGAIDIPLEDMRERLDEFQADEEVYVYCQVGLRSYIASRILKQKGVKVKNISGGYKLYNELKRAEAYIRKPELLNI